MACKDHYPGVYPANGPLPANRDNPTVRDVTDAFARLATRGDYLAIHHGECFPGKKYTMAGTGGQNSQIHFQGIQRLRSDRYMLVSGGDNVKHVAHLFLIRLSSPFETAMDGEQSVGLPYGSNLIRDKKPVETDKVCKTIAVEGNIGDSPETTDDGDFFWHGGGIARLADIVAVPVEGGEESRIIFLNFTTPTDPTFCGKPIERRGNFAGKAGAVALIKRDDGRYVCGVWSDSDQQAKDDGPRLDLYLSSDTEFKFPISPTATWHITDLDLPHPELPKYQTIAFVKQADGQVYFIGTENTAGIAPNSGGTHVADLFYVDQSKIGVSDPDIMNFVASKRFLTLGKNQFDMDAASGVHVDQSGQLSIYTGFHYRRDGGHLQMVECAPEYRLSDPTIDDITEGWVELYDELGFQGRRLRLYGWRNLRLNDYKTVFTEKNKFDKKVRSVRFQLPKGVTYRLYREPDYGDGASAVDLIGTGFVREVPDLGRLQMSKKTRSSRTLE